MSSACDTGAIVTGRFLPEVSAPPDMKVFWQVLSIVCAACSVEASIYCFRGEYSVEQQTLKAAYQIVLSTSIEPVKEDMDWLKDTMR